MINILEGSGEFLLVLVVESLQIMYIVDDREKKLLALGGQRLVMRDRVAHLRDQILIIKGQLDHAVIHADFIQSSFNVLHRIILLFFSGVRGFNLYGIQ